MRVSFSRAGELSFFIFMRINLNDAGIYWIQKLMKRTSILHGGLRVEYECV